MVIKCDPSGALNINHANCIFIVLQQAKIVYDTNSECCEPCSSFHGNILIQHIIQVFGVFYLYTLYMIDYHYGIQ